MGQKHRLRVNAGAGRKRWGCGSRQALRSLAGKRIEDGLLAAGDRGQKEVGFRPHDLSMLRPERGARWRGRDESEELSADPPRHGPEWLMTARWAQSSGCQQTWEQQLPAISKRLQPPPLPHLAHGQQLVPPCRSSIKASAFSRHQQLFIRQPVARPPPLTPARRHQPWGSWLLWPRLQPRGCLWAVHLPPHRCLEDLKLPPPCHEAIRAQPPGTAHAIPARTFTPLSWTPQHHL